SVERGASEVAPASRAARPIASTHAHEVRIEIRLPAPYGEGALVLTTRSESRDRIICDVGPARDVTTAPEGNKSARPGGPVGRACRTQCPSRPRKGPRWPRRT